MQKTLRSLIAVVACSAWLTGPVSAQSGTVKIVIAFPAGGPVDFVARVLTLDEQGIRGVESNNWYALFAPAKTPPAGIEQLNAALRRVLIDPWRTRLVDSGADPKPGSPEHLAALIRSDSAKWGRIIHDKKIKGE